MAKERNFFKKGNVVKTILVDLTRLAVFHERLVGYKEALMANTPLKADSDYLTADTEDGMMNTSLAPVSAIVSANPQVTHWIACGGNDDTAIAAVRIFEEMGIDDYIACGLGGYDLALEELDKGNDRFITTGMRPDTEGYTAAEHAYNFITNGTPIPQATLVSGTINNVDNYKTSPFWTE
jgi:L-arabinose transport system substrate-binding protein